MAIRDVLWACPLCGTAGGIRPLARGSLGGRRRRGEGCTACSAEFARGVGATIVAYQGTFTDVRQPGEWLKILGPLELPAPAADGTLLGPEPVRVRETVGVRPLRFGTELLGWVEDFGPTAEGTLTLREDGLHFAAADAAASRHWQTGQITAVQPASTAIQIGLGGAMAAVRFIDGPVRLWTRGLTELLRRHYRLEGCDVLEFQPRVRICPSTA
jgi:hypothetical protein